MRHLVGIVGYRGYSGAELVSILRAHPHVRPVLMEHRAASDGVGDSGIRAGGAKALHEIPATPDAVRAEKIEIVCLATPAEVSMQLAPQMLDAGARVIDLSGAFRLRSAEEYARWYREPHTHPELLPEAVYGLPEFCRDRIARARLLANPGCYPTAANLALQPLTEAGIIDRTAGIVCDAKSGVSGAGRKPSLKTSFCEVTGNFSTYSILNHRHVPEVLMVSGLEEAELSFTAQLLPVHRGILETIYFRAAKSTTAEDLISIYEKRYKGEPFIRIYEAGRAPDLKGVEHTNFCDIGLTFDAATGRAVGVSAIDHLVKGAAGRGIQNMNLMLGLSETEGLL